MKNKLIALGIAVLVVIDLYILYLFGSGYFMYLAGGNV